jgi:bacterioferritin-associated ferredoxin
MYVCVCNAISDRDVRACGEGDCSTVAMAYRSLGKPPKCGKCVPLMRRLVRQIAELPDTLAAAAPG